MTTASAPAIEFDPLAAHADPYPIYRRLRDEAPVHYNEQRRLWSVTRFDDVMQVLKTPELFSSRAMFTMIMGGGNEKLPPLTPETLRFMWNIVTRMHFNPLTFWKARNLIAEDGERHSSMRAIVNRGFTPRQIAEWEPRVREVVEECLAPLRRGEPFDVVADLAVPVPVTIIAEMLGVPPELHRDFKRWSDFTIGLATAPDRDERLWDWRGMQPVLEFLVAMKRLTGERRAQPRGDLISTILAEQEGATALTDREVIQFVLLLLVAGNETTTNLIGNLANALLEHPDQLRVVAADPSRIPALVEEGLRYDSPVQVVFRKTTDETEIRGARIPKGEYVAVFLGSANRDERRFPDPDRLDVDRDAQGFPGFGFGKHFCLGASLARLEARVAFETLVPELLKLERAERTLARIDSFLIRGPKRLPLRRAA
ncbi:MAG: cytochrome P450 [Deltaproteobacteria bacterium]|nr:MAG: cytochrome P450 [Deltaproteobacteria bacterium]